MVIPQQEMALSSQDVTGDLLSGEIPESQAADVLEDLPSGKMSKTEAKAEDVEMDEAKEEEEVEVPQDEPLEITDYTEDQPQQSEAKSMTSEVMLRGGNSKFQFRRCNCKMKKLMMIRKWNLNQDRDVQIQVKHGSSTSF